MRLAALFLALATLAFAQPGGGRPGASTTFSAEAAFSSSEEVTRGPQRLGEVSVQHQSFTFSQRFPLNRDDTLIAGLAYGNVSLDSSVGLPLPERLQELSLRLSWERALAPGWFVAASARPGFSGDRLGGDAFNVPVMLLGVLAQSRELVWTFGVNANALNRRPVMPVAGVRWEFTPGWTFALMYPRAGFSWKMTPGLTWQAGLHMDGGGYRITRNLGVPAAGIARLANTRLDVRELRAGLGAEWDLGGGFALGLEAGVVTDRKFDYHDRNYRLDTNGGPFAALSFKGSF